MAKRSKKKYRRAWNWPTVTPPSWQNVKRGSIAASIVLVATALLVAAILGVPRLEAYVSEHHRPKYVQVHFTDPPAWVLGGLDEQLVRIVIRELDGDPLRRDDLVAVRQALLNTGWFDSVDQVRRVSVERLQIDAQFVDPYAMVRWEGRDYLIDTRGRLLPAGEASDFITILGCRFPPPGRPGLEWEGSDLIAAIRLHRLIDQQPWRHQIKAIDITHHIRGEPMRLITNRDTVIVWGSAPGEEAALEALTDRKLAFLNHYHSTYRHIDGGHDGVIDITDHSHVKKR